jgi:hypothetical protein
MRFAAPEVLPLMAEAYAHGISFVWKPDGLEVVGVQNPRSELVDDIRARSKEIRDVLAVAQVSYASVPAIVRDTNNTTDYPLTPELWSDTCPHDGWPSTSHDHSQKATHEPL